MAPFGLIRPDGFGTLAQASAPGACRSVGGKALSETSQIYAFGAFQLDPARRLLTRGDEPVLLSARAFDILCLLVEQRGRLVSKDEIFATVWRGMIVEENNLPVQISALRRALGEGGGAPMIVTVAGQGYRFAAPVTLPDLLQGVLDPPTAPSLSPAAPSLVRMGRRGLPWPAIGGAALVLVGVIAAIVLRLPASPPAEFSPPPRLSMVVLPFRDVSQDSHAGILADAVTDDLTTDLSHLPGAVVIGRGSADALRRQSLTSVQIGHALNVKYLVEGSLGSEGGQLLINAALIEAATGMQLWSQRFVTPRAGLDEAQETIVRRVGSALGVALDTIEAGQGQGRPDDQDALALFFQARSILDRSDALVGFSQAQTLLQAAVAKQPDFVDALSELGWTLLRKADSASDPTDNMDVAQARAVISHALALAPGDAGVLTVHGLLQATDSDFDSAETSYRAALAIDPNNIRALSGLTKCQTALANFDQAAVSLQTLVRLDPQNPENSKLFQRLGFTMLMLGRPAEAITWLHRAATGDPDPAPGADSNGRVEWGYLELMGAYFQTGDIAQARRLFATYQQVWPHRSVWRLSGLATKAQANFPAFRAFMDNLASLGLPRFTAENADDGVAPADKPVAHDVFAPTPRAVPGVLGLDTAGLAALLKSEPATLVIGVGQGASLPPTALKMWLDPLAPTAATDFRHDLLARVGPLGTRKLVIMGDGPYGWTAYNTLLQLRAIGLINLAWYRGGEEAWARAGLPAIDARSP